MLYPSMFYTLFSGDIFIAPVENNLPHLARNTLCPFSPNPLNPQTPQSLNPAPVGLPT